MYNNINTKPSFVNFKLMVIGQIISILGSAMLRFALSLYVLDITGRADIYATLFAISNIPILLSPIGGAFADRFNRKKLMVIFDFTSSAIVFCFIVVFSTGKTSINIIGVFMFLLAFISALYQPAVQASIPLLVDEKNLEKANGVVNGIGALANLSAPVLGGLLYGLVGVKAIIFSSCILFFLSAFLEVFIKIPFVKREWEGHMIPTIVEDMKKGFAYIVKQSYILKSLILAVFINLILTPFFLVGSPIILRVTMHSSDAMYGLGMGFIQVGTILGALSMGVFAKKIKMKNIYCWIIMISILIIPMGVSVSPFLLKYGFYPSYILFFLGAVPIMMALTIVSIFLITMIQKKTPNELLGKVMSIISAVAQCAAPIGQVIYGVLFESFNKKVYLPTFFMCVAVMIMAIMTKRLLQNEVV